MCQRFLLLSCLLVTRFAWSAEPLWHENFDGALPPRAAVPPGALMTVEGRGKVAHLVSDAAGDNSAHNIVLPLPLEKLRGTKIFLAADVKATNISRKPNSWNGVKVMLVIETPSGKDYPQAEIPEGTFDWQRFSISASVPSDATNLLLILGLEMVTGEAWFDNVRISPRPQFHSSLKVDPTSPIFFGHAQPRLRGAMAGSDLTEEDVRFFGEVLKGNLLRLQIFVAARKDRALADYDMWLEERLQYIDRMLGRCAKYGVMAVIDLHSPPGGQAFSAGYITARGHIFNQPEAQAKFIQVWQKITMRYKGHREIWGFDLVNEPDDTTLGEDCLDWNALADKTARAVRALDPDRTLIIEPNSWGSAKAFATFEPLDLPRVVYSFHFYEPMAFTHQGIQGRPAKVMYPGLTDNRQWDKAELERAMEPAIEFARKYHVQMYAGEFSAIRTAPGDSAAKYLADVIDIFERHGFDWSYHAYREWQGWSLEHEGPLDKPVPAAQPTDRLKLVSGWFAKNGTK